MITVVYEASAPMLDLTQSQAVSVTYERHLGVRAAVALLVQGHPDIAADVLARSVERQAFLAGCGQGTHVPLREAS